MFGTRPQWQQNPLWNRIWIATLETSALFETVRLPGFDDSSLNGRLRQGLRLDGKACSSASLASRGAQEAM